MAPIDYSNNSNILLAFLFLICYLSFWYSSLKIFKKTEKLNLNHRIVFKILTLVLWNYSLISMVFFSSHFIEKFSTLYGIVTAAISVAFILISLVLFWLSARTIRSSEFDVIFSEKPADHLVTKGPYKYIRHPFYASYILTYSALIILNYDYLVSLIALLLIVYYHWAAIKEEKKFLEGSLSETYKMYKEKTKMFFPYIY